MMASAPTTITVGYERKYSDGNYGSEGLSMMVSLPIEDYEGTGNVLKMYAALVREQVLGQLAKSPVPRIARVAAEELNPRPRPAVGAARDDDSEDPEDLPF